MTKFVYDFAEGDRDQKDLLGGKGANLAEMTNLGLPVPPGFTITTEACRAYLAHGAEPDGDGSGGLRPPRRAREGDGQDPRRRRRPAAGQRAVRRQVLDAGDDGDRPQRRPQRQLGRGPRPAGGRRALRLGLLPPADPDVRRDGARHPGRALRRRPRRREEGQGVDERPRSRCRRLPHAGRDVQGRHPRARRPRLPAGAARPDGPGRPGGLRLVELLARQRSTAARSASPPTSAPRSACARWCSATSAWTRAPASRSPATPPPARGGSTATTCRTPRARTWSPASATPSR